MSRPTPLLRKRARKRPPSSRRFSCRTLPAFIATIRSKARAINGSRGLFLLARRDVYAILHICSHSRRDSACAERGHRGDAERCPSWPKEHDWKSCMRQKRIWGSNPHPSATFLSREDCERGRAAASNNRIRRGGRVVEGGSLENCFTGIPGNVGSNPTSSASFLSSSNGAFFERIRHG